MPNLLSSAASSNFNSIKVQLKRSPLGAYAGKGVFQFHKGTIKTYADAIPYHGSRISIP